MTQIVPLSRSAATEVPWPSIPARMLADVDRVVAHLRNASRVSLSASSEVELPEQVRDMVEAAMRDPVGAGLSQQCAEQLYASPDYRAQFEWSVLARASVLWPLSLLVYGTDIEEIRRIGTDWMVEDEGGARVLTGDTPAVLRGPTLDATDTAIIQWFQGLIGMPGVVGASRLSEGKPLAEVVVPAAMGPVRIAVAIAPVAAGFSRVVATIRTVRRTGPETLEDFVAAGVMPRGVAAFLRAAVRASVNIVIAGGTGSGKTTLMRVLASEIPPDEIIVTVEDAAELELYRSRRDGRVWHPRVIALTSMASSLAGQIEAVRMDDLVRAALRHRPTRVLLGEARGPEMADVASAMTSGHEGSLLTIHANSAAEAGRRAAMYVAQSEAYRGDHASASALVHQAFQLCVHLRIDRESRRRVVDSIVAYAADGATTSVYERGAGGRLERRVETPAELPGAVARAFQGILGEIPPP